jgi:hypothetical protein
LFFILFYFLIFCRENGPSPLRALFETKILKAANDARRADRAIQLRLLRAADEQKAQKRAKSEGQGAEAAEEGAEDERHGVPGLPHDAPAASDENLSKACVAHVDDQQNVEGPDQQLARDLAAPVQGV